MNLVELIASYGYAAVFFGSVFEGETILVLGGLAAHEGLLRLQTVLLFALCGAIIGDLLWFAAGRKKGHAIVERFPRMGRLAHQPQAIINRHPKAISFSVRFLFGFRSVVPFALGMSGIRTRDFLLYNSLGAVAWVSVIGGAGFLFGNFIEGIIGNIRHYEFRIIVIVILIAAVAHAFGGAFKSALKRLIQRRDEGRE